MNASFSFSFIFSRPGGGNPLLLLFDLEAAFSGHCCPGPVYYYSPRVCVCLCKQLHCVKSCCLAQIDDREMMVRGGGAAKFLEEQVMGPCVSISGSIFICYFPDRSYIVNICNDLTLLHC